MCIRDRIILFGNGRKFFKIRNIQPGITNRLEIDRFGVFINVFDKAFRIISIGKPYFDAPVSYTHLDVYKRQFNPYLL